MFNLTGFEAFLAFVGTLATGLLGYFGIVKRNKPDEASIALAAWKDLLDPLRKELEGAKEEIKLLRISLEQAEARHRATEIAHKKEQARLLKRIKELEKGI